MSRERRHVLGDQRRFWRDKLLHAIEEGVLRAVDRRLAEAEERAAQRHQELMGHLRAWERRTRRDVWTAFEQEAARTSAELVREQMPHVVPHTSPYDTLRHALSCAPPDGLALEFGVATGATLRIIARSRRPGSVFGFDSFQGLPEFWRLGYEPGRFGVEEPPDVPGAELVVGLFADVLPDFLAEHPEPVAFVHIDSDLYGSALTVLEQVGPRLVEGAVLVFDEFYNFPDWREHEYRALTEYAAASGLEFDYLGLTMDDEQVSVRVTRTPRT